jgi:hypothetical protein
VQLFITPPGGRAFMLGNDAVRVVPPGTLFVSGAPGGIQDGFLLKQERILQVVPLLRASYRLVIPRYNLINSLTFLVSRTFATWELTLQFIALHADQVPALGEITMTHQSATGTTNRYLPNAVLQACECVKHTGVTCHHKYTFQAPNPWQSNP